MNRGPTFGLKLLLEGPPRVGKSTVLGRLASLLRAQGVDVVGFLAEEIRADDQRVGVTIRSLDGGRTAFAHVDHHGAVRVGRYGVDLAAFERVALPLMDTRGAVLLMDELGRMQLASAGFRDRAAAAFATAGCVVATVHVFDHPFTNALKRRDDVSVLPVTESNRDGLATVIANRLIAECH